MRGLFRWHADQNLPLRGRRLVAPFTDCAGCGLAGWRCNGIEKYGNSLGGNFAPPLRYPSIFLIGAYRGCRLSLTGRTPERQKSPPFTCYIALLFIGTMAGATGIEPVATPV